MRKTGKLNSDCIKPLALTAFCLFVFPGCAQKEPPRSCDWIASVPDSEMKRKMVVGCTSCHPIGLPVAFRLNSKDWNEQYLKMKKLDDELELRLIPYKYDMELPDWLGAHSTLPKEGFRIKTAKADIKEFSLGAAKGFYHDMALAGGRAWIADYFGNVLYGINPETGATEQYPIPAKVEKGKPAGAHAIDVDEDGFLWICLTKAEQVARFDPQTKSFKLYSGYPKGGNVQYFVLDKNRFIYHDKDGCFWTTHFSKEILCRTNPKTGKITTFHVKHREGMEEGTIHLYAAVADSNGLLWFTETHGDRLGWLDPQTGKSELLDIFETWAGPKRLAIDDEDRLWIPQLASGLITVYDTKQRTVLKKLPLPIPGDYVYCIRRDRYTGNLWATGCGSDSLYRIDPKTFQFTVFRLPRLGAFTRTTVFDGKGNVWTNYACIPNEQTQMPYQSGVIVRLSPKE
ncbi:MAG TPA: hypothetical protein VIJ93_11995 [bacterium]